MGIIAMYSTSRDIELRIASRHSVKGNVFAEGGCGRFRPRQPRERVNSAVDGFSPTWSSLRPDGGGTDQLVWDWM